MRGVERKKEKRKQLGQQCWKLPTGKVTCWKTLDGARSQIDKRHLHMTPYVCVVMSIADVIVAEAL